MTKGERQKFLRKYVRGHDVLNNQDFHKKTEVAKKNERTTEEECGIFRPRRTEEQTKEVAKVVMDEVWVSEWIHEETEDVPGGCVCVVDNGRVDGGLRGKKAVSNDTQASNETRRKV